MTNLPIPKLINGPPLATDGHGGILPDLLLWADTILQACATDSTTPISRDSLAAALAHSRHFQTLLKAHSDAAPLILGGQAEHVVTTAIQELRDAVSADLEEAGFMAAIRRLRQRSGLAVILSDICEMADVETQMEWMSKAADAALDAAVAYLFQQAERRGQVTSLTPGWPGLAGCGWTILALGKLGAGELNYSSDLDLILLHDPQATPLTTPDKSQQFYVEMTRALVRLLGHQTANGIGWRIDLRLRPDPGATAVSIQREAAIGYYESIARTWERAAFIRARPVAGDLGLGQQFLDDIQPFIWRRTLDYTVMDDMKTMLRRQVAAPGWTGFNLKTGPNGIRSIEFLTHVLQLVAGGRAPETRKRSTLPALQELARTGWITDDQAGMLGSLYHLLRRAEHRLQMLADGQTHSLPRGESDLADFARFLGHDQSDSFLDALSETLNLVGQNCLHRLFDEEQDQADTPNAPLFDDSDAVSSWVGSMGFARPDDIAGVLSGWMAGRIPTTRGERARSLLTRIMPDIIQQLATADDPDTAFVSFAGFVEGLPASVQIFSLLDHNRDLTRLLCDILVLSPRLANQLRRHPMLFDLVLFDEFFAPLPDADGFETALRNAIDEQPTEMALDTITRMTRERRFRIEVQMLSQIASRQMAGHALADTADAVIRVIRDLARADMERRHGRIEGGFDVLALGRLGIRDMTATSDIDLIYLWHGAGDGQDDVRSDGSRSLAAGPYFMRMAQTLTSWLGGATGEGQLFTVDLRLRPDGDKGPLAPSLARLEDYYRAEAWLWERLALAKARCVTAAGDGSNPVTQTIADIIARPATQAETATALQDMRRRLRTTYGAAPEWQLRKQPGGIAELDLLVQGLRLVHAELIPDPAMPVGDILERLASAELLSDEDAVALETAHAMFGNLTHALRLVMGTAGQQSDALAPPAIQFILASCDCPDIASLNGQLAGLRSAVDQIFDRLFPS